MSLCIMITCSEGIVLASDTLRSTVEFGSIKFIKTSDDDYEYDKDSDKISTDLDNLVKGDDTVISTRPGTTKTFNVRNGSNKYPMIGFSVVGTERFQLIQYKNGESEENQITFAAVSNILNAFLEDNDAEHNEITYDKILRMIFIVFSSFFYCGSPPKGQMTIIGGGYKDNKLNNISKPSSFRMTISTGFTDMFNLLEKKKIILKKITLTIMNSYYDYLQLIDKNNSGHDPELFINDFIEGQINEIVSAAYNNFLYDLEQEEISENSWNAGIEEKFRADFKNLISGYFYLVHSLADKIFTIDKEFTNLDPINILCKNIITGKPEDYNIIEEKINNINYDDCKADNAYYEECQKILDKFKALGSVTDENYSLLNKCWDRIMEVIHGCALSSNVEWTRLSFQNINEFTFTPAGYTELVDSVILGINDNALEGVMDYTQEIISDITKEIIEQTEDDEKSNVEKLTEQLMNKYASVFVNNRQDLIDKTRTGISWGTLPLSQAREFARFILETTIKFQELTEDDIPTVGGTIELHLITTRDGFQKYQSKS